MLCTTAWGECPHGAGRPSSRRGSDCGAEGYWLRRGGLLSEARRAADCGTAGYRLKCVAVRPPLRRGEHIVASNTTSWSVPSNILERRSMLCTAARGNLPHGAGRLSSRRGETVLTGWCGSPHGWLQVEARVL